MWYILLIQSVLSYELLDYEDIVARIESLNKTCEALTVTTGQDRYNISIPEQCDGCQHHILTLSLGNNDAPQIYFSGELHGDERLGASVLIELTEYMCDNYMHIEWISRLLKSRRIVMTPMTNVQGFKNKRREEIIEGKKIDPNRDFGYDDPGKDCMQTTTARLVNELFNDHIFLLSITFHGGDNAIGYPWGAPNHAKNDKSTEAPDLTASDRITTSILNYSKAKLKKGPITDTVYWVKGGMEDWAYGAAWENQNNNVKSPIVMCKSDTYQGYEAKEYKDVSFRDIMFIVESDDDKSPREKVGEKEDVLTDKGGLIPQYIRMTLALIDMAEPYISVSKPSTIGSKIRLSWKVWGCVTVDETKLNYIPYSSDLIIDSHIFKNQKLRSTPIKSGSCRWGDFTEFSEELELSGDYLVFVSAVVDQDWILQDNPDPNLPPQSHIVKIRTTEDYHVTNGNWELKGGKIWKSEGIKLSFMQNSSYENSLYVTIYNTFSLQQVLGVLQISQSSSALSVIHLSGEVSYTNLHKLQLSTGSFGDIRSPIESSFGSIYDLPEPYCNQPTHNLYDLPIDTNFNSCNSIDQWIGNSILLLTPNFEIIGAGVVSSESMLKPLPSTGGVCSFMGPHGYLGSIILREVDQGVEITGYLVFGYYQNINEVEILDEQDEDKSISIQVSKTSQVFRVKTTVFDIDKKIIGKKLKLYSDQKYDGECTVGTLNPHFYDALGDSTQDSEYKKTRSKLIYVFFGIFALGLIGIFLCLFYRSKKIYTPVLQDVNLELEELERTV